MNPAPRAVFFDAAGTLLYLPRGVGFHYADVAARHGWEVSPKAMAQIFGALWKSFPPPPTTRTPRQGDDRPWWRELVRELLDSMDPPATFDRDKYFEDLYLEFTRPGVWALYPEVIEVLDALPRTCLLGIVSNFDGRLRLVLQQLGLSTRFSRMLISSEVGADKPDPWIFSQALAGTDLKPAETLLVGDDPDCDFAGAQRAGWRALHIDRPTVDLRATLQFFSAAA